MIAIILLIATAAPAQAAGTALDGFVWALDDIVFFSIGGVIVGAVLLIGARSRLLKWIGGLLVICAPILLAMIRAVLSH